MRSDRVAVVVVATIWCAGAGNAHLTSVSPVAVQGRTATRLSREARVYPLKRLIHIGTASYAFERWLKDTLGSEATIAWASRRLRWEAQVL